MKRLMIVIRALLGERGGRSSKEGQHWTGLVSSSWVLTQTTSGSFTDLVSHPFCGTSRLSTQVAIHAWKGHDNHTTLLPYYSLCCK
jgi:hypothetical protein